MTQADMADFEAQYPTETGALTGLAHVRGSERERERAARRIIARIIKSDPSAEWAAHNYWANVKWIAQAVNA
jgi:hypothetical protein